MKKTSKLIIIVLCMALVFSITACQSTNSSNSSNNAGGANNTSGSNTNNVNPNDMDTVKQEDGKYMGVPAVFTHAPYSYHVISEMCKYLID